MKRRKIFSSAHIIAGTSLAITIISVLWNIFFGYGELNGRMNAMQEDISEIKSTLIRMNDKMDKGFADLQDDLHKIDLRINTLEQRKP